MSIKKARFILPIALTVGVSFFWYGCSQELEKKDVRGPAETVQVKNLYHFLANLENADIITAKANFVEKTNFIINDEWREVLYEHADSEVTFKNVLIHENAELRFGIGINQGAWDKPGDGVMFEMSIIDATSKNTLLFSKYIDPKNNVEDRKWFDEKTYLGAFAGQTVSFIFKTTGGPKGDRSADWAGWSSPQILAVFDKLLDDYPINIEKTKYDLIEKFPGAEIVTQKTKIKKSRLRVKYSGAAGEERQVISAPPPSEFRYHLTIPDKAFLQFGVGVVGDWKWKVVKGVKFEVYVNQDKVFSRHVTNQKEDNHWFDEKIDLSKYSGQTVNLSFRTHPESPNSTIPVRGGWSNLLISELTPVRRNLSSKDQPNIILIVIDTQRADHLSCYGYHRDTSPNLNKLAQEGVLFENAVSQSSWTWPATATILTGLYPYTHGVISEKRSFLVESINTLAEILQENHFTTFGISANPLISKDKNFDQGFETFIERAWQNAETLNHEFFNWLETNKGLQFFAYLHFMDPHDPYSAPGKYYDMFDPDYEGKDKFKNGDVNPLWFAVNFDEGDAEYTDRDIEHLKALYDGEIRYWDSQFGELLEQLKELNILDKTIIVVTSDHGEEFMEHDKLKHGLQLYDETIRVPLIIWFPEIIEPRRIEEQVETVSM